MTRNQFHNNRRREIYTENKHTAMG